MILFTSISPACLRGNTKGSFCEARREAVKTNRTGSSCIWFPIYWNEHFSSGANCTPASAAEAQFNAWKLNCTKHYLPPIPLPVVLSSGPSSGSPGSSGASASHRPALQHRAEVWPLQPHLAGAPHQLQKRNKTNESCYPCLLQLSSQFLQPEAQY